MLLAWGRSHRTSTDGELIRWGTDLARVEGRLGGDTLELAVVRAGATGTAGRKRIRVNGIARRASSLSDHLRVVVFAPEEMLLVAGSPSLRRGALDQLAAARSPRYADAQTTYTRTLQQRNSLLRAIREEGASRDELRYWDTTFVEAGGEIVAAAPAAPRRPGRAAGGRPRRDRARRGRRERSADPLRHERAGTPRRVAAGRPRPTARRDGRQGGLERLDARRSASRRPRVRARGPGSRRFRVARPAADGDPRLQAGRTGPADRARRPAAAAPARRRLLRTRPGPARPPRASDRRAAPGVHHDDDPGRPGSGASGGRHELGGRPAEAPAGGDAPRRRRRARRDHPRSGRWSASAT